MRRDAVMALVESASDGWLFLMNGVMSVCNDIHVMSEGNRDIGR